MTAFLKEHPESQLVYGAYKRLVKWTNGQPPDELQQAWQEVEAVQKQRQQEAASCGPQALAYVLKGYGIATDWQALMKECQTTEEGADLGSLAQAARHRGISCTGLEVSKQGLLALEPPLILWSRSGHYQVVQSSEFKVQSSESWVVYDPQTGQRMPFALDALPEEWRGIVLVS
jgi:ABC-type bacteriocin/lantibiotic exporter with double-glycine peptidase domain